MFRVMNFQFRNPLPKATKWLHNQLIDYLHWCIKQAPGIPGLFVVNTKLSPGSAFVALR